MNHWTITALTGLALYQGAAYAQSGHVACERMRSFHYGASHVLAADYFSGAFTPPPIGSFTPRPIMLPPHCSVRIVTPTSADSTVTSEIWLPDPAQWNGKMLGTGNGGYSSALSYSQMATGFSRDLQLAAQIPDTRAMDSASALGIRRQFSVIKCLIALVNHCGRQGTR